LSFALTLLNVRFGYLLQVVDVVKISVLDVLHAGLDVARTAMSIRKIVVSLA